MCAEAEGQQQQQQGGGEVDLPTGVVRRLTFLSTSMATIKCGGCGCWQSFPLSCCGGGGSIRSLWGVGGACVV